MPVATEMGWRRSCFVTASKVGLDVGRASLWSCARPAGCWDDPCRGCRARAGDGLAAGSARVPAGGDGAALDLASSSTGKATQSFPPRRAISEISFQRQGAVAAGPRRDGGQRVHAVPGRKTGGGRERLGYGQTLRRGWRSVRTRWRCGLERGDGPAGLLRARGRAAAGAGVADPDQFELENFRQVPAGDGWTSIAFDDRGWARALDLGVVGSGPWGRLAFGGDDPSGRFRVPEGFAIETVAQPSVTGSVVAFTFESDGHPCVSIERGPIARLIDDDKDGRFDRRQAITPR